MSITLLDALATPEFVGSSIVAGWSGLARPVQSVTVAEVPDAADWLDGGELVLTTAYMYRADPDGFRDWLESLIRGGAAAICVKHRRFLGQVPESASALADSVGVPLVALANQVTWPHLIEALLPRLARASDPDPLTAALAQLLVEGQGFAALARLGAAQFQVPVLIHNADGVLLGAGVPRDRRDELLPMLRGRFSWQTVRRVHEVLAARRGAVPYGWPVRPVSMPVAPAMTEQFFPLHTQTGLCGYLSRIDSASRGHRRADLWQVCVAVSAAGFRRLEESPSLRLHAAGRRLVALLRDASTADAPDGRLRHLLDREGTVVVVSLEAEPGREGDGHAGAALTRDAARFLRGADVQGLVASDGERLVFVMSGTRAQGPLSPERWARGVGEFLLSQVPAADGRSLRAAVGTAQIGQGLAHYRLAYHQALMAWRIARIGRSAGCTVEAYPTLGAMALVADPDGMTATSERLIGPVRRAADGDQLYATLTAFFSNHGSMGRAARQLFIHRNTLRYRLQKVARLSGADPFTSDGFAALYLAWRMSRPGPDAHGIALVHALPGEPAPKARPAR